MNKGMVKIEHLLFIMTSFTKNVGYVLLFLRGLSVSDNINIL